ncbi:MAG: AMP-binding protein [Rhodospirillales bacterium]|jgi:acyl-CoA synthetase (AMP-forming)/AMP-acid ligase II|nr:AMP-binding protein [Rhodospirillales bacterium]
MLTSDTLEWAADRIPDREAWSFGATRRNFAEADRRANRVANALLDLGYEAHERIAVLASNSDQSAELFFALGKAGLVAVPLNIRSSPAELRFICEQARVSGIFVSTGLVDGFRAADLPSDDLKAVIDLGEGHGLASDYEALAVAGSPARPPRRVGSDDLRVIKFTSGTTGTPKGCMGTHRECLFNVMSYLITQPYEPHDVCGLVVSLGAGLGSYLLTAFVYRGCRTVILDTTRPGEILDAIAAEGITRLTVVPTMIGLLIDEQAAHARDLSSLELIHYTGSPATVDLIRRGQDVLGCGFYQSYGATESGGRITHLTPEQHRRLVASAAGQTDAWGREVMPCGLEQPGFEVRLEDDDGNEVPDGTVGELVVRGESVFKGYWNLPELNAEVLRDGWWRSGDLARRATDGTLYIVDRKKDMIVSGGYNVYSVEVEQVLDRHPDVAQVAVVGVPHPRWGEAICAFVLPRAGIVPEERELEAMCRDALASYKVPKRYVFVDTLPMTTTGKIRKTALRDRAVADRTMT